MSSWQSEMTNEEWESIGHKPMNIMDKLLRKLWKEKQKQIYKELNTWMKINQMNVFTIG